MISVLGGCLGAGGYVVRACEEVYCLVLFFGRLFGGGGGGGGGIAVVLGLSEVVHFVVVLIW